MKRRNCVDIRKLKSFALEELPRSWTLRYILLSEKDILDVNEFLAKTEIWLKILKREESD